MTAIDEALQELGVPAERRHYEHFGHARFMRFEPLSPHRPSTHGR